MDVSIIIVNYKTFKLTKNTIISVIQNTKDLEYEIIVVDNASNDNSIEKIQEYFKDQIIVIKNDKNIGFGSANNCGIKISKGKYVFLLNSDTILLNNAIKYLFEFMENNPRAAITGGNLYDLNLNPTHSYSEIPSLKTQFNSQFNYIEKIYKRILGKRSDFNYTMEPKKVGYITGADMMIRRNILLEVGFFDEDFFMYSEEAELTSRIKKLNMDVYSIPYAKIIHLESKSTRVKLSKVKMMQESYYKYFYKVYGMNSLKFAYLIFHYGTYLKAILTFNKLYLDIIKINKDEFLKFLNSVKKD